MNASEIERLPESSSGTGSASATTAAAANTAAPASVARPTCSIATRRIAATVIGTASTVMLLVYQTRCRE